MIDSHTHLSDEKFDSDRDEIISESLKIGVKKFTEILCCEKEWEKVNLFKKYSCFYFVFGIHPHDADIWNDNSFKKINEYLKHPACIGIGETGIDLWYYPERLRNQIELMEKFIEKSKEHSKPLIFHIRNSKKSDSAYRIVLDIIKSKKNEIKTPSIVHSFSGEFNEAKEFIENGFFIGINATITYPGNRKIFETVKNIPLDMILTETDSPYLPPQRIRGKRNDPRSVKDIINAISEIKKISPYEVERIIDENFERFVNQSL